MSRPFRAPAWVGCFFPRALPWAFLLVPLRGDCCPADAASCGSHFVVPTRQSDARLVRAALVKSRQWLACFWRPSGPPDGAAAARILRAHGSRDGPTLRRHRARRRVLRLALGSPDTPIRRPPRAGSVCENRTVAGLLFGGPPGRRDRASPAASCRLSPLRNGPLGSRASLPGSLQFGHANALARM